MGKIIPFERGIVQTIEECESAMSKKDFERARELFDKAFRMNADSIGHDYYNRLEDIEQSLFYR